MKKRIVFPTDKYIEDATLTLIEALETAYGIKEPEIYYEARPSKLPICHICGFALRGDYGVSAANGPVHLTACPVKNKA